MQPELFREVEFDQRPRRFQAPLFPHRFLRLRVAYEDLIFVTLGLILALLAGFCLGVERGKHVAAASGQSVSMPGVSVSPLKTQEIPVIPVPERPRPVNAVRSMTSVSPAAAKTPVLKNGPYVIQLASYGDAGAARAEQERLRRQGFNAQVIKQGKYFELRVIGYQSKSDAVSSLAALKRTYHDGFIKRLSPG